MKRFTETQKWEDAWYRKLTPAHKLLWQWICDKCDQAGVIEPDWDLASFQIGAAVDSSMLDAFAGRIAPLPSGKLHVVQFVQFQYGKLSRSCKPHMPVYAALARHGMTEGESNSNDQPARPPESLSKATRKPIEAFQVPYLGSLEEKEKEQDKETDKETGKDTDDRRQSSPALGSSMDALRGKINTLRPEWTRVPHFTSMELYNLQGSAQTVEAFTDSDWSLIAEFLAYKPRGDEKLWQVKSRSKFIESPVDVLTAANEWAIKNGRVARPKGNQGSIWK